MYLVVVMLQEIMDVTNMALIVVVVVVSFDTMYLDVQGVLVVDVDVEVDAYIEIDGGKGLWLRLLNLRREDRELQ